MPTTATPRVAITDHAPSAGADGVAGPYPGRAEVGATQAWSMGSFVPGAHQRVTASGYNARTPGGAPRPPPGDCRRRGGGGTDDDPARCWRGAARVREPGPARANLIVGSSSACRSAPRPAVALSDRWPAAAWACPAWPLCWPRGATDAVRGLNSGRRGGPHELRDIPLETFSTAPGGAPAAPRWTVESRLLGLIARQRGRSPLAAEPSPT